MGKAKTAEDDNFDPVGGVEDAQDGAELGDAASGLPAVVERPDPAAAAGVVIETKMTVTAPSLAALATYIDGVAEVIEAETGGEVSGRSTKAKQEAVGKAKGLREAARLVRAAKLTAG